MQFMADTEDIIFSPQRVDSNPKYNLVIFLDCMNSFEDHMFMELIVYVHNTLYLELLEIQEKFKVLIIISISKFLI